MSRRSILVGLLWLWLTLGLAHAGKWACNTESGNLRVLVFTGGIASENLRQNEEGEHKRFLREFNNCFPSGFAGQRVIDLDSGGGAVVEALNISKHIAQSGGSGRPIQMRVSRGSYCISACTYIFIAGQFREVASGGSFEPHGFSSYAGEVRIDLAVLLAKQNKGFPLNGRRLLAWHPWLVALAKSDSRFNFVSEQWTKEGISELLAFLSQLTPEQLRFVGEIDAIVNVVMPELQREAALFALEPTFDGAAPRYSGPLPKEDTYVQWLLGEMDRAARRYLNNKKDNREPQWDRAIVASLGGLVKQTASDSIETASKQLWDGYLSKRTDIVQQGLLRAMFSVSILYTRPLTREELCAFNIVNENCYE